MSDLTVFALGVLALLAVWKFMLRPAIQDAFKDMLFDVRENLRRHFARRGQLNTEAYREMRDSLNAYIRFIEVANLALTYQFAVQMDEHPKVAERYQRQLDRRFDVKIPSLARSARVNRQRCSRIIQFYVFHSSFFSVGFIYLVLLPMAVTHGLFTFCRDSAMRRWKPFWLNVVSYIRAKENGTIKPQHTELFSQVAILSPT